MTRQIAKQTKQIALFARDWVVPALILIILAVSDGLVRTLALAAFLLVVASRALIVVSDRLKKVAPKPITSKNTRHRSTRRAAWGGTR